jgi:hypothetical protein
MGPMPMHPALMAPRDPNNYGTAGVPGPERPMAPAAQMPLQAGGPEQSYGDLASGMGGWEPLFGQLRAAGGGFFDTGQNTSPTVTLNRYDPSVLGNQPFIQQLQGRRATAPFQGVGNGQLLSNPQIGAYNISPFINLQTLRDMLPSAQAQTQDLYEQGLAQYWPDVLARSQRAAPTGANFGVAGWG